MVDGLEGITAQDAHIAGYIHDAAKGIIIVINKWDLVRERRRAALEAGLAIFYYSHRRGLKYSQACSDTWDRPCGLPTRNCWTPTTIQTASTVGAQVPTLRAGHLRCRQDPLPCGVDHGSGLTHR